MKRPHHLIFEIFKSRIFWFITGVALLPVVNYMGRYTRGPTAFEAMRFVSDYQENKHFSTVLPDFTYSLRFPGDREKFESFIKKMKLEKHKVSDEEYREDSGEGGKRAIFSPDKKGSEIEFSAWQT